MVFGRKILIVFSLVLQALAEEECDAQCRILRRVARANQRLENITTIITQLQHSVAKLLPAEDPLDDLDRKIQNAWSKRNDDYIVPRDCQQIFNRGLNQSGIYRIHPLLADKSFYAPCVFSSRDNSGWTVILHRSDALVNFNRTWDDYKNGFGSLTTDFWLGLEHIYQLTAFEPQELLIEIQDENYIKGAYYSEFAIADESRDYFLEYLGNYSGDAGDAFSNHIWEKFYTFDRDNAAKCALENGGWWFTNNCGFSNLNGFYQENGKKNANQGITWDTFINNTFSAKEARMMIRPKADHPEPDIQTPI